jgi:microcystin-dependent protein
LGVKGGDEKVTLTVNELASHNHTPQAVNNPGSSESPGGAVFANATGGNYYTAGSPTLDMNNNVILDTGGGQSHTNMMPFLCINFIVALFGIYPSRN